MATLRTRLWHLCTTLLLFVVYVSAASLSFIEPTVAQNEHGLNFTVGDMVNVTWSTEFDHTTLKAWQGPLKDGSYVQEVLAANQTRDNTTILWPAAIIKNANLAYGLHFELLNGHDPTCQDCTANSVDFRLRRQTQASSTSTTHTTPMPSSTSSTSSTKSPASSTSSAPATDAALISSTNARHRPDLAIPLGVGLGVGIPLLLAVVALLAFCILRRRRKEKAANLPRGRQPPGSAVTSWSQENMEQRLSDQPLMPSHQQAYMPYRPSYTRSSGMSTNSKSSSFFEPFDFERPGSQVFDPLADLHFGNGGAVAPRLAAIDEHDQDWPLPAHRL